MAGTIKLGIKLTADGKGFVGEIKASQDALKKLGGTTNKTQDNTNRPGVTSNRTAQHIEQYASGISAAHQVMAGVRDELFAISQKTRTELESNAELYNRLSMASDNYGYSQTQLLKVTELLNVQVLISGNSSTEAAENLIQFAQKLSNVVDAIGSVVSSAQAAVAINALAVRFARINKVSLLTAHRLVAVHRAAKLARTGIALLGGPAGILMLAAYAAYEFATANDEVKDSLEGLPESVDAYREFLAELSKEEIITSQRNLESKLSDEKEAIAEAQAQVVSYRRQLEKVEELRAAFENGKPVFGAWGVLSSKNGTDPIEQIKQDINDAIGELNRLQRAANKTQKMIQEGEGVLAGTSSSKKGRFSAADKNALKEFEELQAAARTEMEKINATYAKRIGLIIKNTAVHSAERDKLGEWASAQRDAAVAALEEKKAREQVEQERRSGLTTLNELRTRNKQLASVTDFSAAAKTKIVNEVTRNYEDALPETIAEIIHLTVVNDELSASHNRLSQAYETVRSAHLRYQDEIAALESLKGKDGVDESLRLAEIERLKTEGVLQVKRIGWEQEALETEGYHSRVEQAEVAHKERMIDIEYTHSDKIANVKKLFVKFEKQTGTERVKTGLTILEESAGHMAAHSKKAFRLQQAASIANATINMYEGISHAWGKGLPWGPIEAAVVAVAGIAQINAIRSQQPPQAFAKGGVVMNPTLFQADNVNRGLMSEVGPEAIMPLARMPGGALGVRAKGGSLGNVINITFSVTVPESVRNPQETGAIFGDAIRDQLEPMIRSIIVNEQRPGGELNRLDAVA